MRFRSLTVAVALVMGVLHATAATAPKRSGFRPISPEEFALTSTPLLPDAPAITLLREVSIDTDLRGTRFDHYVRMKVLTAHGVQELGKTQIQYFREAPPRQLVAQVVKPDGRTVPVPTAEIFTRDLVRARRTVLAAKSFAFPALEPGDIVEYRYSVTHDEILHGQHVYVDDPFPVRLARVRLRANLGYPGLSLQLLWSALAGFKQVGNRKDGFHTYEAANLAPLPDEPLPPPDTQAKRWFLYYFTLAGTTDRFWSFTGRELVQLEEHFFKPTKALQEAAQRIAGPEGGESEKLERLHEFCRTKIKNLTYDTSGYTEGQIELLKLNKTPTDTLTNGYGHAVQINLLFGALARAAGLPARLAYCGDRSRSLFDPELRTRTALPDLIVACGEAPPQFYDPGSLHLPARKLQWRNEGTAALVASATAPHFATTPSSGADTSVVRRTANFRLETDGTIEGDVTVAWSGHPAFEARHEHDALTAEESAQRIERDFRDRLGASEITNCRVEGITEPGSPVTVSFHIRVPGYAEVAGRRLIVPPAFFQRGVSMPFPAAHRTFDIFFPFPTSEEDKVSFDLPEGFEFEPQPLQSVGDDRRLHYFPRISLQQDGRRLLYERSFRNEISQALVQSYASLRAQFIDIHTHDNLVLSFQGPARDAP